MRVLMMVQLIDEQDWLRGFIVPWVRALAAQVERVDVLTLEQHKADLPANVTVQSMGKERHHKRLYELMRFHQAMRQMAPQVDVIFSHMTPRYTWLAAPYAFLYKKPQVLWFVHRQVSLELRLAHAVATRIVTASPESFRLPSHKVAVLGHGIDLTCFYPAEIPSPERLILSVGRLSPIKNHEILIEAVAHLIARDGYQDVQVAIAGASTAESSNHKDHLQALSRKLGVDRWVRFLGAVPHQEIPALYRRAALTVNLCPTGGMDKAVLESMASGVPVIVHNRTFLPFLGDEAETLWCRTLDPELVAGQIAALLDQPPYSRAELGIRLRERVEAEHSLEKLVGRLVEVFEQTMSPYGQAG